MKKLLIFIVVIFSLQTVFAQRKMENIDRGVVGMWKNTTQLFVSWRYLATDSEDIAFNVYRQIGAQTPVKLNANPITGKTNFVANGLASRTTASQITVRPVINGVEQSADGFWNLAANAPQSRIVMDYDFEPIPGISDTRMTFCWVSDLDNDGKYDFVLERQAGGMTPKLEAYSHYGEFKWRVDVGDNVKIVSGHNDMVTAYDMDGDGKAEVLLAVSEGTTFADGNVIKGSNGQVTDYNNRAGSAPQWLSIIDGETGIEIDRAELPHFNQLTTTRTDDWKHMAGHFVVAYLDGINPYLIYQYKNRLSNGNFQGALAAWRFKDKKLELYWSHLDYPNQNEFHQVRAVDIDGDGRDDFIEGGYVINSDGSLHHHNKGAVHGDVHTIADMDPDRPGLEHFVIQQDNPSMLGMAYYDAATGDLLRGYYLTAVADVARGFTAAIDPTIRGMQFVCSNLNRNVYDCKGESTGYSLPSTPGGLIWWDGDLSRQNTRSTDGNGNNFIIEKLNPTTKGFGRIFEIGREHGISSGSNDFYYQTTSTRAHPAFRGDILGDWREEMIVRRGNGTGFAVLSTWDESPHRLYCLMQNPSYRNHTTAKGYYWAPDVDYYFAQDMPLPPVPPVQKADLYYTGSGWIDGNNVAGSYADGKSIMFDIRGGNNTYTLSSNMSPSHVLIVNPKGKDYTFNGEGKFTGSMGLTKTLQGTATLNGNHSYTGITRISEGKLIVNGTLESKVRVDARGVLSGNATLNGGIVFETGLNVEGGRIEPGNGANLGTLTVKGNLNLPGRNNLMFDVDLNNPIKCDTLVIDGDFMVTGNNHTIIINPISTLEPVTLTLIKYTGSTNASPDNFKVQGVVGIPYELLFEEGAIKLNITESRSAGNVTWQGSVNNIWNFTTPNFLYNGEETIFVFGDRVTFNDNAAIKDITVSENLLVSGMIFNNNQSYTLRGQGAVGGTGGLTKTGSGSLSLLTNNNTFTGAVDFSDGTLIVSSLKDGGTASSIGASTNAATNWIMRNATLQATAAMATNRNMQIDGKLTVNSTSSSIALTLLGNIGGNDAELEATGSGTLTLSGLGNNFKQVTLRGGTLVLGSRDANTRALGTAKLTLLGGTFRMASVGNNSDVDRPFTTEIEVPAGATARWENSLRWEHSNKLTGGGNITINIPGPRCEHTNIDWSEFAGVINFIGGNEVRLGTEAAHNMGKAEINLATDNRMIYNNRFSSGERSGSTFILGALSGSGGVSANNNLVVGGKNVNTVYSGVYGGGSGRLTKNGTGSMRLSAANTYTGGTVVNGGALVIANTSGSGTGTGAVTVNNTGTLMGTGIITGSVTVNAGGSVMPGLSETQTGNLRLNSNITVKEGAVITIKIAKPNFDILSGNGNLVMENNSGLRLINTGADFAEGDEFVIFAMTGSKTIDGKIAFVAPPALPEGLVWDLSNLATTGSVKVVQQGSITELPSIITTLLPDGLEGNSYTTTVAATGDHPMIWTVENGNLPNGLTLSTNGIISGTAVSAGTFTFTVKASNEAGNDSKELSIIIAAVPPAIVTASLPDGVEGEVYTATLTVTGTQPIEWTINDGNLPVGLELSLNGTISGTPTEIGRFNFTVKAENTAGFDTKQFSITINVPPIIITESLPDGTKNQSYEVLLEATSDLPVQWDLASGNLPDGLTLSTAGLISGTPTQIGTFTFTVKASNTAGYNTKELTIVVLEETNINEVLITPLKAWTQSGKLYVSGLAIGEQFSVYNIVGAKIYQNIASNYIEEVTQLACGVYIIAQGEQRLKVYVD